MAAREKKIPAKEVDTLRKQIRENGATIWSEITSNARMTEKRPPANETEKSLDRAGRGKEPLGDAWHALTRAANWVV